MSMPACRRPPERRAPHESQKFTAVVSFGNTVRVKSSSVWTLADAGIDPIIETVMSAAAASANERSRRVCIGGDLLGRIGFLARLRLDPDQ
jgi:hypothetical protein